jgi:hypothetical protein
VRAVGQRIDAPLTADDLSRRAARIAGARGADLARSAGNTALARSVGTAVPPISEGVDAQAAAADLTGRTPRDRRPAAGTTAAAAGPQRERTHDE